MRALIVDIDNLSARTLRLVLKVDGVETADAETGEDALSMARSYDYDVILTEMALPDMSAVDLVRKLRAADVTSPLVVISTLAAVEDKVRALCAGADDYVTRPYHRDELIARIRAVVRRANGHATSELQVGDLIVNISLHTAAVRGLALPISPTEYQIVELLALRQGATVTKSSILDHLYGGRNDEPSQKIIDVYISKIRKKLRRVRAGVEIHTIWGRGYTLREPAIGEAAA